MDAVYSDDAFLQMCVCISTPTPFYMECLFTISIRIVYKNHRCIYRAEAYSSQVHTIPVAACAIFYLHLLQTPYFCCMTKAPPPPPPPPLLLHPLLISLSFCKERKGVLLSLGTQSWKSWIFSYAARPVRFFFLLLRVLEMMEAKICISSCCEG